MYCPACGNELTNVNISNTTVDICKGGCGGIWFDNYELEYFDEAHEGEGEQLLDFDKNENISIDHTKQHDCPKCKDTIMMRHFFTVKHEVEVDECAKCGGIWLDSGELGHIRQQYHTEDARNKAASEYFEDILEKQLDPMRKESREQLDKAERIAHMFRFICPSYYFPSLKN